MADPATPIGSGQTPPLGIPPRGVPPTDGVGYKDLTGLGKLRPLALLDVREFGAIGDGAHDDAPAIARALAEGTRVGKPVYLPHGTYKVESTISVPPNARLLAVGNGKAIIKSSTASPILSVEAGNNVYIAGLAIDGVDKGRDGIFFDPAGSHGFCHLARLNIVNCASGISGEGISASDMISVRIASCTTGLRITSGWVNVAFHALNLDFCDQGVFIDDAGANEGLLFNGMVITHGNQPVKIEAGTFLSFVGCVFDLYTDKIMIFGGHEMYFTNCWFSNTSGGSTDAAVLVQPIVSDIKRLSFTGCMFANSPYYGLLVANQAAEKPDDVKLTACDFVGNGSGADGGDVWGNSGNRLMAVNSAFLSTIPPRNVEVGSGAAEVNFEGCKFGNSSAFSGSASEVLVTTSFGYNTDLVERAAASSSLTLSVGFADVVGATITLPRAGRWLIRGYFDLQQRGAGDNADTLVGQIVADGAAQAQQALFTGLGDGARATVSCEAEYVATTSGKIVKLRGKKTGGSGTSTANITNTHIVAEMVSRP